MDEEKYSLIYTTGDSQENLEAIAKQLLEESLIACANMFPGMTSMYKWKGQIQSASEIAMLLKAKSQDFPTIEKLITNLHSYDCPVILEISIANLNSDYQAYLKGDSFC